MSRSSKNDQNRSELFSSRATSNNQNRNELFGTKENSRNQPNQVGQGRPSASARPTPAATAMGSNTRPQGRARATFRPTLTPAQAAEKEKEAAKCRKKGLKLLSRTMTRWKPDYLMAASQFERAGKGFRAVGKDREAKAMFIEGAKCQIQNEAYALAAKNYREAALLAEMAGEEEESSGYYQKGAEAWVQSHDLAKAAEYTSKAAKLQEDCAPSKAASIHLLACRYVVPNPELKEAVDVLLASSTTDVFHCALMFLLETKRYEEASTVLAGYVQSMISSNSTHTLYKLFFAQVAVLVKREDEVAANRIYQEEHLQHTQYLYSPFCKLSEQLLTAKRNFDSDGLRALAEDPGLRHLDQPIQKVVKEISLDGATMAGSIGVSYGQSSTPHLTEEDILLGQDRSRPQQTKPKPGQQEIETSSTNPFDLSDLTAGMEEFNQGVGTDDEDLDALIAAAKKEAQSLSLHTHSGQGQRKNDGDPLHLSSEPPPVPVREVGKSQLSNEASNPFLQSSSSTEENLSTQSQVTPPPLPDRNRSQPMSGNANIVQGSTTINHEDDDEPDLT